VKKRFPFKCNLQRYNTALHDAAWEDQRKAMQAAMRARKGVGLCTLNQVDPCPITYSLSNPYPITYQVKEAGFKVCLSNATCSATKGSCWRWRWAGIYRGGAAQVGFGTLLTHSLKATGWFQTLTLELQQSWFQIVRFKG
jgi:hypothetical protein